MVRIKRENMIFYKFLNADKTATAKYVTGSFYDVNEKKSLKQFYVTELREVSSGIVKAGINIEIGMYHEAQLIGMAKKAGLTLEKWSDNTFVETLVVIPTRKNMTFSSPTGNIKQGAALNFAWTAVVNAKFYEVFVYADGTACDFSKPTFTVAAGPIASTNTYPLGKINYVVLVHLENGNVEKSQVGSFTSTAA